MPRFDKRTVQTWLFGIALGILLCCGAPLALLSQIFTVAPPQKPAVVLRDNTGLVLPPTALVRHFEYDSWLDSMLQVRFETPKADALAFLAQKPFAKAKWERDKNPMMDPDVERPKPPYRATSIDLPDVSYLRVAVEERGEKPWIVWVQWFTT